MTTAEWNAEEQSLASRFDFSTASRQSDSDVLTQINPTAVTGHTYKLSTE